MKLRLLSYNIRYGGVGREEGLAAVIHGAEPDLVLLQEASRPDVVKRLADRTGMAYCGSVAGGSVAYLSRVQLLGHEWRQPRGCSRSLLRLDLAAPECSVFALHLQAMHSNWSERRRVRELKAILSDIASHRNRFHLLAGDFNTLAPGEKLDRRRLPLRIRLITSLLGSTVRWETIQIMLDAGYADAFRALHPDDAGVTFPTWDPHLRLDYLFVPAATVSRVERCEVVRGGEAAKASDHFPLLAVVAP